MKCVLQSIYIYIIIKLYGRNDCAKKHKEKIIFQPFCTVAKRYAKYQGPCIGRLYIGHDYPTIYRP